MRKLAKRAFEAVRQATPDLAPTTSLLTRAGYGVGTAGWLFGLGLPLGQAIKRDFTGETDRERYRRLRSMIQARQAAELMNLEMRVKQRRMAQIQGRMAATNPQMYNEIMAGRVLPPQATVLGGVPRQDLMNQVASQAVEGGFQQQPDPNEQLRMLLQQG